MGFDDLSKESTGALATSASIAAGAAARRDAARDNTFNDNITTTDSGSSVGPTTRQQRLSFDDPTVPFALIDEVTPGSPAFNAGLKEGDTLLRFGSINHTNHSNFRAIAELLPIAASENRSISVSVRRKSMELGGVAEVIKTETFEFTPRTWSGRGLLGCHIRPITK